MKIHARGQARHHFWAGYSRTVTLTFDDAASAALALPVLRKFTPSAVVDSAIGLAVESPGWIARGPHAAIFVTGKDVNALEDQLVSFGASAKKIGSLARSVDHGEPFQVAIDVEDPNQTLLFTD